MENIIFKYKQELGKNFLQRISTGKSCFLCTIAHTETSGIPGISAAGANEELIKYTPAADVEAIYYGKAKCLPAIPENPKGPPSPVIISIAALDILKIPFFAINAGVKIKPFAPMIEVNGRYGNSIEFGNALKDLDFSSLKDYAEILANEFSKNFDFIILGESVPGGTTTAMALLNALGYNAFNRICGSMPGNQHALKIKLVEKALNYISPMDSPIEKVLKIGDPMQPFQALLTIKLAERGVSVLLAGGTQMVAVAALVKALTENKNFYIFRNIAIATTKWVSEDCDSDIVSLMNDIQLPVPLFSANLNFLYSKHDNLKLYEEGYVKEGVGAGALSVVVFNNTNKSHDDFLKKIESVYEKIYNN